MPPDRPDSWTTAVLCAAAATGTGACDHLDCHDGPFIVVLVGTDTKGMFSYVFSSETYKWSEVTTAEHPGDCISWNRSTLVENALHFMFEKNDRILKYDLRTRGMSLMELPRYVGTNLISEAFIELMTTKEGRLGFARLEESKLCLWSRDHGDVGWVSSIAIELDKMLPFDASLADTTFLVGFAEGVGVIFVRVGDGVFTIDLQSCKVIKVYEGPIISCVVPYMSFCTPALRAASTDA
ncbi:hypothetical protein PVAP13_2KG003300 [Panicum virgatum]|uniref:F-box protein AT5G49610-like beta-propeller domain-containing protein n=2 Tax=Panicum virgatum TaxID=38727 RepID=A0A8T0W8E5_PANVG|nr:hypothetical protein PVAP13_2KG003300 [Panicum virgatum]